MAKLLDPIRQIPSPVDRNDAFRLFAFWVEVASEKGRITKAGLREGVAFTVDTVTKTGASS